jgi:hypothetical protein
MRTFKLNVTSSMNEYEKYLMNETEEDQNMNMKSIHRGWFSDDWH